MPTQSLKFVKLLFILLSIFNISISLCKLEFAMTKIQVSPNEKSEKRLDVLIQQKDFYSFLSKGASLLDLYKIREGLYTIDINLGMPLQKFQVILDTGSYLLWVANKSCLMCSTKNKFDTTQSKTLHIKDREIHLGYLSGKISGKESHDQLTIGENVSVPKFRFLLSDDVQAPVKVDGIIGFARINSYGDEFSFINSLYSGKVISEKIFTQKIEGEESKFIIGEFPEEIAQDMENYSTCKAIDNNNSVRSFWSCNLKKVLFSNLSSDTNLNTQFVEGKNSTTLMYEADSSEVPAIFDTGANVILAPPNLFQAFHDIFFKTLIENKSCSVINDHTASRSFECESSVDFNQMPKMHFLFDNGMTYELDTHDLFIDDYRGKLFRIIFSNVPGNGWLLGQPFLKQYHMVFNQQEQTIGFYHDHRPQGYRKINNIDTLQIDVLEKKGDYIWHLAVYIYLTIAVVILILGIIWKIVSLLKKTFGKKELLLNKEDNILNAPYIKHAEKKAVINQSNVL